MRNAALLALLLPLQDRVEWKVPADGSKSLAWKYSEKAETSKDKRTTTRSDVREVEGRVRCDKSFAGSGVLEVALTRVSWIRDEERLDARRAGGSMEIKPGAPKAMMELLALDHRLRGSTEQDSQFGVMSGKTFTGGRNFATVFRGAYVQGGFPSDLGEGTEWFESILSIEGLNDCGAETDMIRMKVVSAGRDEVRVAGELQKKYNRMLTDCVSVSGTLTVRREFVFARAGWLASSREEVHFTRNSAGEKLVLTISQELALK